jgi:hypothetical protein
LVGIGLVQLERQANELRRVLTEPGAGQFGPGDGAAMIMGTRFFGLIATRSCSPLLPCWVLWTEHREKLQNRNVEAKAKTRAS